MLFHKQGFWGKNKPRIRSLPTVREMVVPLHDALMTDLYATDDASKSGAFLSFSGDAEDTEEVALDQLGDASKADEDADEDEDDDAEPEDDFNAAWEVLDLARALYEKRKDEDDEVMLKLAETYITLGDVSLETGE